jgi:hypothetical protein
MKGCTKGCEEDIHQSNGVGMREEQFNNITGPVGGQLIFFIGMRLSRQTRLPLRMHNVYCTSTGSGKMEKLCLGHCALTSNEAR